MADKYDALLRRARQRAKSKERFTKTHLLTLGSVLFLLLFLILPPLINRPSKKEKQAAIKIGQPIIEAVNRYKNDKGQWPQYTEDFVPEYLEAMPNQWHYHGAYLRRKFNNTKYYMGYNFIDEHWVHVGDGFGDTMDVEQSKPMDKQKE